MLLGILLKSTDSIRSENALNGVFLDIEQGEIRRGLNRLNAGAIVDPDNQDTDDLEGAVTVAGDLDA
jgi:hypothetical protein